MSNTSIGRGPAHGSNENHDGDPLNKTMGEKTPQQEPPVGNDVPKEKAGPALPAGKPQKSPPELDAALEDLPKL